jgi:hypothetical protein
MRYKASVVPCISFYSSFDGELVEMLQLELGRLGLWDRFWRKTGGRTVEVDIIFPVSVSLCALGRRRGLSRRPLGVVAILSRSWCAHRYKLDSTTMIGTEKV